MKKSVVFLDIDGVLQPEYAQKRFKYDLDELRDTLAQKYENPAYRHYDKYDLGAVFYDWDQASVENLKLLLKKTNAEIVLSSSWRKFNPIDVLKNYFRLHDLDAYIVDYAPILDKATRAVEVETYLNAHPEISHFLILDDIDFGFSAQFPHHFVQTGKESRLTDAYLQQSLEILSKPTEPRS